MASPAQVANDMEARAAFWAKRSRDVASVCRDAARVIRAYLFGPPPHPQAVRGVLTRLERLDAGFMWLGTGDIKKALSRAYLAIVTLRDEART